MGGASRRGRPRAGLPTEWWCRSTAVSRAAGEHACAVVRTDFRSEERRPRSVEHVERLVVGIRRDPELRVVREAGVLERVAVVRPGRVSALRHGDALQERRRGHRELRDDPPIGDRVVQDLRVPVVVRLAAAAEAAPQRVDRNRAVHGASALVEDGEIGVDRLDVVVRANVAVRVGRSRLHAEGPVRPDEPVADTVEAQKGRRHRRPFPSERAEQAEPEPRGRLVTEPAQRQDGTPVVRAGRCQLAQRARRVVVDRECDRRARGSRRPGRRGQRQDPATHRGSDDHAHERPQPQPLSLSTTPFLQRRTPVV